ncbi:MAG: DNA polymerase Y family protein [Corynebacterium sp.]|uniref:Y-family DNA polymerase n=1 Tax=Corynebacterium sp. TaxID=1720 RepID=UPI0026DA8262|nr:DNA polymerase Y family protein [Corynebacterium sp.]MDO5030115.1 DNA polymerase Y family protein [Corynebacterium sp.]
MAEVDHNRVVALWLPDWPVQAAHLASATAQADPLSPVAIVGDSGVAACSPSARRAGVRRGQSRRHAEALCPQLDVVEESAVRDAAEFEPVMQRLEAVAAGVEALRPGLAVVAARGVVRYYGGQDTALEKLLDAAAVPGVDCSLGLADDIVTAILAARRGILVAPGAQQGKRFRQGISLVELMAESALGLPAELAKTWQELGLRTLGDVGALPKRDVANRFGAQGARWHDLACHGEVRLVAPRSLPPGLEVTYQSWETPLRRVDEASFVARSLAAQLHEQLFEHGYSCYRLAVVAQFSDGSEIRRVWRCAEPLAEQTTADRVRWQLDGWLNNRNRQQPQMDDSGVEIADDDGRGIVELRLEPMDVVAAGTVKQDLWHGSDDALAKARRAAERVQGLLGPEAVQQPVMQGGRGPAERVGFVAFGEKPKNAKSAGGNQPWPGAILNPNPAITPVAANAEVDVLDASGQAVGVTGRATMTAEPAMVRRGAQTYRVSSWAGPWPIDERWWVPDEARRAARMQVQVTATDGKVVAWLLIGHAGAWKIEGAYE